MTKFRGKDPSDETALSRKWDGLADLAAPPHTREIDTPMALLASNATHLSRRSENSVSLANTPRSASELVSSAQTQLNRLSASRDEPVTKDCARNLMSLLTRLVVDGSPLPQLTPNPFGSVEVNWLVAGMQVTVVVEKNGSWALWAERPCGLEIFDVEGDGDSPIPACEVFEAQRLLADMGRNVRHWPNTSP